MVAMKELTELRARASRAKEILVRAHERGFGEQLATELLADLNQAIDIIDRLQQVKIPPLLFGEQLLRDALAMREMLSHLAPTDEPVNEVPGDGHDERISNYGDTKCGCSWDSGPYTVYCSKHSPFSAAEKLLTETEWLEEYRR